MSAASDRFVSTTGAPLEYWFWKLNAGPLAFLVDFIVRRPANEGEVRVSLWVRGEGRVIHSKSGSWTADGTGVSIDSHRLDADASTGQVEDVAWDLAWRPSSRVVTARPGFFGPLHPFDLEQLLLPDVRFSGSVTVAGETFTVEEVPGSLMHYWGRRLPDQWCWISASEFPDDPVRRVEALVGRSTLWGHRRFQMTAAYLWTVDARNPEFTLSPVTGLIRLRRSGDRVDLSSVRIIGGRHRVTCHAAQAAFNDLGEGIRQTLLADLTIDGQAATPGTVGLEFRG